MDYRLLGPLEVLDGDRVVPLPRGRPQALLALLLIHANELVPAERLIDRLWGESPPPTAGKGLQVTVSRLRKELGGAETEGILTRGNGYLLCVGVDEVDGLRFERLLEDAGRRLAGGDPAAAAGILDEALALWRGPALAGFEYESFAQQEIARLEELRLVAQETRAETGLALGEHAQLVGELESLVREHPLRGRPRAQLMLALYRSGRQAEALDVYRTARRELAEEFGLEPGDELRRLEDQILRQDPALDLQAAARSEARGAASPREPDAAGPERGLLVAPQRLEGLDELLAVAEHAASSPPRELVIAVVVPKDRLGAATAGLTARRDDLLARGLTARTAAFSSPTPGRDIARLAGEDAVDLLFSHSGPAPLEGEVGVLLEHAPCDVALLVDAGGTLRDGPVVVPFGAAWHDWAALQLGASVAGATGAPLRLIGAASGPTGDGRDASRLLADASLIVQRSMGIVAEPLLGSPGRAGVISLAEDAGLLVAGLAEGWREDGLGRVREQLVHDPPAPTLLVRRGSRTEGLAPAHDRTKLGWSLTGGAS